MHAKSTVAVALLGASTLVSAGSAIVHNQCNFPVYLTPVTNVATTMHTLGKGQSWSQGYMTNPDGGGISIKMATQPSLYTGGAITQLEYTIDDTLWYDMSNINGNPFMQWGMTLKSSSSACRNVLCAAGVEECDQAYNNPDENENTAACTPDSDLVLTLCSSEGNSVGKKVGQAVNGALDIATGNSHKHHHKEHHHKEHHHKEHHHKEHHHNHSDHKKHHNKHHKEAAPVPAPAPVSVSSPAPVVSAPVAAATTFLTQIVTVTARDAKPSADAHAHANYHRHHFQRRS